MWWKRKVTFGDLAKKILEQKILLAPTTYAPAKVRLERLIEHFGNLPLCKVTEIEWQKYVLKRLEGRPKCKFFDDRKYMRQVMLEAQRRGLVVRTIRLKIPDLPTATGREITEAERARLFQHVSPELRFQMDFARLMGLRPSELFRLRWDRFDWERLTICLLPVDTKTRRPREVPINPDLVSGFRRLYFLRHSAYVFPRPTDPSRPRENNRAAWRTCKRKAGVECRWEDWRHTCATQMLRRGETPQSVSTYMGNSEKILTRIYQHLNIEDLRKVARTMSKRGGASV